MLNLNEYDAFEGFDFYINIFLGVLSIALCFGIFIVNTRKNFMIRTVKQLYRHGANTEENAKSPSELRIKNTLFARKMLLGSNRLSRAICRVGDVKMTYEEYLEREKTKKQNRKKRLSERKDPSEFVDRKPDFDTSKFYIGADVDMNAKSIISKSPTSLWQNILLCVFVVCITVCITLVMPGLLSLLDSWLS